MLEFWDHGMDNAYSIPLSLDRTGQDWGEVTGDGGQGKCRTEQSIEQDGTVDRGQRSEESAQDSTEDDRGP